LFSKPPGAAQERFGAVGINEFGLARCVRYTGGERMSKIQKRLFTVDEYSRMADTGILSPNERTELIDGEIVVMSPIGPRHHAAVDGATRVFVMTLQETGIVRVQGNIVLHRLAAPQPDLVLLRPRRDFYASQHAGASDVLLLVEVADSSLDYDTTAKLNLYAIMQIPEYWVADLKNNRLLLYRNPEKDSYLSVREFHRGDVLTPHLLPDCRIDVAVLLP
jgi:Uma2 family endonuclease